MCGIFGIYKHKDAARLAYLALYALQHRGEESAGIVSLNGKRIFSHKAMGEVYNAFDEDAIRSLKGDIAIGHVRYSTTGSSNIKNAQPFLVKSKIGHIAIAHNGNLINAHLLREQMEEEGSIFQTTMDSEVVAHLLARSKHKQDYPLAIKEIANKLQGAYSLVLLLNDCVVALRDPYGWRPLCLGKLDGAYVVASETCALDLIQAQYLRDIEPGEAVFIDGKGINSIKVTESSRRAFCIFEYIYFARPDSNIFGHNVYLVRKKLGQQLAKEFPAAADLVMPIPDSGNSAAMGFAKESGLPYELGLIRNHYVGRTFIQPSQFIRNFRVKVKLNPIRDILNGKRIVVVEDSIVRGTTSRGRVKTLREAGAKEIHMRVSCPPLRFPCFYGIDFPTKKELVASKHDIEWISNFIGVDNLAYLSLEGMLKSMPCDSSDFCTACFTGEYPISSSGRLYKQILES